MAAAEHTEPCGCRHRQTDVPDDQGYGQGWQRVHACASHMAPTARPPVTVTTGRNPDGTWWGYACRGQHRCGQHVTVGRPTVPLDEPGLQTERAAEAQALRCWWDTAELVGWV